MARKYKIDETGEEVLVYSLSFGYMYDIENSIIDGDNLMLSIEDATNLDTEGVRGLRRPDAFAIWELIKKETYPELYDENGVEIPQDGDLEEEEVSKKKV